MTPCTTTSPVKAWLESLRLRTLPLAFASIVMGSALASLQGVFHPLTALLALLTAGLLQILSNLANDYGDAGTSDYITGLMEDHEKMAWMLRAHLR